MPHPAAAAGREVLLGEGEAASFIRGRPSPRRISGAAVTTPTMCLIVASLPGFVVVGPWGDLDEDGSARLAGILCDLIAGQPGLALAVDLTKVDHFDLAAVEKYEVAAAAAEHCGGNLSMRWPSDEVAATLTTAGLARLISTTAGPPTALRSAEERAAGQRSHPAGNARPDPNPGAPGRSVRAPNLRRTL